MRTTVTEHPIYPRSRQSLHRRWASLIAVIALLFLGLSTGTLPAQASGPNGYDPIQVEPGHIQHIPVLAYRRRHTFLPEQANKKPIPNDYVSYARNVAEFEWTTGEGADAIHWIAVFPSIPGRPKTTKIALVDIFQRDAEGRIHLVDPSGKPLMEADGKTPIDWRTSTNQRPSYRWDTTTVTDTQFQNEIRGGRMHSENLGSWFFKMLSPTVRNLVDTGLTEKELCTEPSPAQCDVNLKKSYFPGIKDMKWLTDADSKSKLGRMREQGDTGATNRLNAKQSSDDIVRGYYDNWTASGMPEGPTAAAQMNGGAFALNLATSTIGPAGAALGGPGTAPGGIDFSTLQLRYISEGSDGQLQYAFDAAPSTGDQKVTDGKVAASQMSDAFYVWLSLPPSTFWVNLNPNEPDRIVDSKLGSTDVGRILLEADLRMKKVVGQLIHPDTVLGNQFWAASHQTERSCINMRQWIVPKPATVYEDDGGLYILDTPLEVKMETDYLSSKGQSDISCATPDANMEQAFRTLVLPKVEDAVNHSPDFAELRRVYLSRVAAEWYRQKKGLNGNLASMIDDGNVSKWPARQQWSPRQVFNDYVKSYNNKEFNVQRQETIDGQQYMVTYTYGGVDMSHVALNNLPTAQFQHDHPDLAAAIQGSFKNATPDHSGHVWLGAANQPHTINTQGGNDPEDYPDGNVTDHPDLHASGKGNGLPGMWLTAVGTVLLTAAGIGMTKVRRRRMALAATRSAQATVMLPGGTPNVAPPTWGESSTWALPSARAVQATWAEIGPPANPARTKNPNTLKWKVGIVVAAIVAALIGLLATYESGKDVASPGDKASAPAATTLMGKWSGTVTGYVKGSPNGQFGLHIDLTGRTANQQAGTFECYYLPGQQLACTGTYTLMTSTAPGTESLHGHVTSGPCNDGDISLTPAVGDSVTFYAVSPALSIETRGVLDRQ